MSGQIRHLSSSDFAIRQLHSEIERLATLASQAYISRTPLRIERQGRDQIAYWYDDQGLKILTAGGTVHMSTELSFQDWPDWNAVRNKDARAIANALWSAAAYVEDAEVTEPHALDGHNRSKTRQNPSIPIKTREQDT